MTEQNHDARLAISCAQRSQETRDISYALEGTHDRVNTAISTIIRVLMIATRRHRRKSAKAPAVHRQTRGARNRWINRTEMENATLLKKSRSEK
jgi:hypothetical protein